MSEINSFGIIGGDKRQLYCGKALAEDGYDVSVCGFEHCNDTSGLPCVGLSDAAESCDAFILPVPVSRDGKTVNAPFSDTCILTGDYLDSVIGKKPVFCGIKELSGLKGSNVYDYAAREEFAVMNSVPTAEGAVCTAMNEYDGTIHGSKCLVAGYGRIGKVLSRMLDSMCADVTVSARNLKDMEFIKAAGMKAVNSYDITGEYDLIFNTVPYLLFDTHTLARVGSHAIIIDLASKPGGVDHEGASRMHIKTVHALSLPGKTAPKRAGEIIKETIYHIIGEEGI